jgi:hypothetical protein
MVSRAHVLALVVSSFVTTTTVARADDPAKLIFLDRCEGGCTIWPGLDSAARNQSSLIDSPAVISEWRYTDNTWTRLIDCVQEKYKPFDIVVTDVKPGYLTPHHRAIVAGEGYELGAAYSSSLGVAPTWCEVHDDVITFTFANAFRDLNMMCAVVAQETGHAYGLEHSFSCDDAMSYITPCTKKMFRDAEMVCGDTEPLEVCRCGGTSINSFRTLMSLLGPSPSPNTGPLVWVDAAVDVFDDGTPLANGAFAIYGDVEDEYAIDRVEVWVNGAMYARMEYTGFRYFASIGDDVSDGILDIEIVAYNAVGIASRRAPLTVIKRAPCQSSADCLDDSECSEGRCAQPSLFLSLGTPCERNSECATDRCEATDTARVCTDNCYAIPGGDTCPDGYWCHDAATTRAACWPGDDPNPPENGGCRASKDSAAPVWLVLALLAGLATRRSCWYRFR